MAWGRQIFGIPIRINASWLLVVALVTWSLSHGYFPATSPGLPAVMYWAMGFGCALLLFVCVLLHELGHSLVAKRFGIPVPCVTLFLFGGVAQIGRDPQRPSAEFAIALAGPLVSVLIAIGCFAAARLITIHAPGHVGVVAIARYLAMINTALICFNLLPGFPLDGGRLVRATLWAWTGSRRTATRVASLMGTALGLGLFVLGVWTLAQGAWVGGVWYMVLGLFLRNTALTSYRAATARSV